MHSQTLRPPIADLVPVLVLPAWSLEKTTLTGGVKIEPGTVLAKVSGKHQPIDFAATGDAKKAAAVAYESVDTTAGDQDGVVVARGAVVDIAGLIWPEGATDAQKSTAITELATRGIIARASL